MLCFCCCLKVNKCELMLCLNILKCFIIVVVVIFCLVLFFWNSFFEIGLRFNRVRMWLYNLGLLEGEKLSKFISFLVEVILDMFIYIFEFFNESGNFLEYVLFFGEILWIKWVYFR